ncbi:hypothetical protein [uncultured Bacteroides sp.]|uniref:hypothetical protein n=1 Tax=uncultured Bacteroides sp. TaxID=162156 RepID=UPI00262BD409|nr:hypothetical protein [uncultured Bacteroides sp.]
MKYPIGIQNFENLRQGGYLTIKDYDKKSNIYKLGFPNKHVKNAFMTLMKYI